MNHVENVDKHPKVLGQFQEISYCFVKEVLVAHSIITQFLLSF